MILLHNYRISNIDFAISGMRLSYNSLSDSDIYNGRLGESDKELMLKLVRNGASHRKFLRAISVHLDISAPRYWWIQFDQYKIGVTSLSESTMHTLMKREIVAEMFDGAVPDSYIDHLEKLRQSGDFVSLIKGLPQSFTQRRVICANYEVLYTIYHQRKGHKLEEWKQFCGMIRRFPMGFLVN